MRFAVVSDIHANLQAWRAVQLDLASLRVDRVVSLGDVVGYGPNPAEVLESVYASVHHFVLGNHDAVLCGKMDADLFHGPARELIAWTADRLDGKARALFAGWPLTLRGPGFRCAHGEFGDPARFRYVIEPEEARPSWQRTEEPLLFVGHTHCPGIFLLGRSNVAHRVDPQDCVVDGDRRFLVNVGSVGHPRDGDARASYVVYDTERRALLWRRIPFDLDAYRRALGQAGVPPVAHHFLAFDPRRAAKPVREQISFRPPETAAKAVRGAVEVAELAVLRHEVRRWRGVAAGVTAAFVLAAAAGGWAAWRHLARAAVREGPPLVARAAGGSPADTELLDWPAAAGGPGAAPPAGWTVRLGDRRRQEAALRESGAEGLLLGLRSRTARDALSVSLPEVAVEPGQRFAAEALFRRSADFSGTVALVVSVRRATPRGPEWTEQFVVKEPNLRRREGWWAARETFEAPAGAERVRAHVRGRFTGAVEIAPLSLRRRE